MKQISHKNTIKKETIDQKGGLVLFSLVNDTEASVFGFYPLWSTTDVNIPVWNMVVAPSAPTTQGNPYSLATTAPCDIRPPKWFSNTELN